MNETQQFYLKLMVLSILLTITSKILGWAMSVGSTGTQPCCMEQCWLLWQHMIATKMSVRVVLILHGKDDLVDYWTFCNILNTQMCRYNPIHCSYPDDRHTIPSMSQNSLNRKASESAGAAARASMSPIRQKH
eukprot:2623800-Ditylum_brightwellii.AAC.1